MTETTWTPTTIALSKLKPWERNPKRISKAHAARLLDLWERLGRRCRAVEIEPGYVAVCLERWATTTGQTPALLDGAP